MTLNAPNSWQISVRIPHFVGHRNVSNEVVAECFELCRNHSNYTLCRLMMMNDDSFCFACVCERVIIVQFGGINQRF